MLNTTQFESKREKIEWIQEKRIIATASHQLRSWRIIIINNKMAFLFQFSVAIIVIICATMEWMLFFFIHLLWRLLRAVEQKQITNGDGDGNGDSSGGWWWWWWCPHKNQWRYRYCQGQGFFFQRRRRWCCRRRLLFLFLLPFRRFKILTRVIVCLFTCSFACCCRRRRLRHTVLYTVVSFFCWVVCYRVSSDLVNLGNSQRRTVLFIIQIVRL